MRNLIALLLVMVGLALEGKEGKPQWKQYTFTNDGFIVSLPSAVTPHKDSQDANFNVYPIPLGSNSLLNLRASSQPTECAVLMRELGHKLQDSKSPDYRVPIPGSFKRISIGGSPALQYEYKFSNDQTGFERYYCTGQKLYIFSVLYPANQPRPSASDRILDSFRLIRSEGRGGILHGPARRGH